MTGTRAKIILRVVDGPGAGIETTLEADRVVEVGRRSRGLPIPEDEHMSGHHFLVVRDGEQIEASKADRGFKRANCPSPLPALCPARLPARRPSGTTQRMIGGPGCPSGVSGARAGGWGGADRPGRAPDTGERTHLGRQRGQDGAGGRAQLQPNRAAGGGRGAGTVGREPEVGENLSDNDGVLDGGHHAHAAATPGAASAPPAAPVTRWARTAGAWCRRSTRPSA
jgi:hypothetical protein